MKRLTILPLVLLSACSTSQQQMMPVDKDTTMLKLWQQQSGGTQLLLDSRSLLRRTPAQVSDQRSYSRNATNEIHQLFPRLPDPDMVLYIFPHLAGNRTTPVPGYSTVFPFYSHTQYALPGEREAPL
ncbi:conjugative transfer region lipoprotein (TIGR03751 family) [Erwinia toletana]|uniref:Conjugative transfer region lipoprotein (TIGR03751 family) n=1 Tax=Winslowiella toletana TaxID=92490 RepID=A0ABS4PFM3_9GAMM|nr:TIGR03751 family conjugal transfer lipoprotein [Winslowiella toletana]MBP2170713.1 conjugative transfer region lipoprotein (TIGR03751 family) [Winslowiella toletana]